MSSYDASERSQQSEPASESVLTESETPPQESEEHEESFEEEEPEQRGPPPLPPPEERTPIHNPNPPKYVVPSSNDFPRKLGPRAKAKAVESNLLKSRPRQEAPPMATISGRSKDIANQVNVRRILAVFPPTDVMEEMQLKFVLRRLGVSNPAHVSKIRELCAIEEGKYDCQKLKDVMIGALNNDGQPLSKRLHRTVVNALANDRMKPASSTCTTTMKAAPVGTATVHATVQAKRVEATKTEESAEVSRDTRTFATERPKPKQRTSKRKPGYLPEFYDKTGETPYSPKRQPVRHTGLKSNTVEKTWFK